MPYQTFWPAFQIGQRPLDAGDGVAFASSATSPAPAAHGPSTAQNVAVAGGRQCCDGGALFLVGPVGAENSRGARQFECAL